MYSEEVEAEVMMVKKYVGEDKNLNVCWRRMLVKTFLYLTERQYSFRRGILLTFFLTNIHVFHQHAFLQTSFTNIRTAKVDYAILKITFMKALKLL